MLETTIIVILVAGYIAGLTKAFLPKPKRPALADDCACGGGDLSGHDAMCPQ